MDDKGYAHPLYSLDFITLDMTPPEEPRYAVLLPQGRLVVRPGLRRRGACVSTAACEEAVSRALAAHRLGGAAFTRFGFDEVWRDSLRYWRGRMIQEQIDFHARRKRSADRVAERRGLVAEGRRIWGRLSLSARLAQLGGMVTRGRAPERAQDLLAALREAALRAEAHRDQLRRRGFGEEERAELSSVIAGLEAALRPEAARPAGERGSETLQVLRGALLGDIALLCQAAKEVLSEPQRQALQLRRALLLRAEGARRKRG